MKKIIVTYAHKNPALIISQSELIKEAKPYFDDFASFSLKDIDEVFYKKNEHILKQERGVGYWLWKPYFIDKVLSGLDEGDYLFYMDSGTSINKDIYCLFEECEKVGGILLFENHTYKRPHKHWLNNQWTKKDCFVKMNCDEPQYVYGMQCSANLQLYKKNEKSVNLVKEYLKYCEDEDILTDKINLTGNNYPEFSDHRHDQSVLSLLAIKHKIPLVPPPTHGGNLIPYRCPYKCALQYHRGCKYGRKD